MKKIEASAAFFAKNARSYAFNNVRI
jgi:hypothetical protein